MGFKMQPRCGLQWLAFFQAAAICIDISPHAQHAQWCIMNEQRIALRDVALAVGVHHSTVSRALKGDFRISEPVRTKIKEAAARLGYTPDPMLSALVVYRSKKQNGRFQGTLAWLTNYPTRDGWREFQNIDYFAGAKRRAGQLGYSLDEIWMREFSPARLSQILLSRNVRGILLPTQPRARTRLPMDWDKFPAVRYGTTIFWPPLRIADSDHFRGMSLLMRQLKKHGYKNPGLVCSRVTHESIDRNWVAAYLTFQPRQQHSLIPPLMDNALSFPTFKRWFNEHQPDVVIATDETIVGWLAKLGLDVPGDVGFALAARHDKSSLSAGLDERSELVGETGVEMLVDMINKGERGLPSCPTSTLVPGAWVEGETVRRVNERPPFLLSSKKSRPITQERTSVHS